MRHLWPTTAVLAFLLAASSPGARADSSDPAALDPPANYSGLRIDRAWTPADTLKTLGRPTAWANVPIPANVTLDPLGPQVAADIQAFARADGSNTYVNRANYTPDLVRAGSTLRSVRLCWQMKTATGVASTDRLTVSGGGIVNWDKLTLTAVTGGSGLPTNRALRVTGVSGATLQLIDPATGAVVDFTTDISAARVCFSPTWHDTLRRAFGGVANDDYTDLHGGAGIPAGVTSGAPGTDGEISVIDQDYASVHGTGRLWEFWAFRSNPDFDTNLPESATNPPFIARDGTRVAPLSLSYLHAEDWSWQGDSVWYRASIPGDPNSERQEKGWGVTGATTLLVNDVVSDEDCAVEEINHAIGLELPSTKAGFRWPAQTSDGWDSTKTVQEGMRLTWAQGAVMPSGMTRLGRMLWRAVQRFGFMVNDQTASSVAVRTELGSLHCLDLQDGQPGWKQFDRFPLSQLVLLKVGSDSNPNPTS